MKESKYTKKALIDFIIPTYNRYKMLRSTLAAIVAQNNGDWNATVVIDDGINDDVIDIIKQFDDQRIDYIFTGNRYNDWGHTPREIGKQQSKCKYVIMTGDDNYYTPNFVSELQKASTGNPGMIYWDMVHSHYDYSFFRCAPAFNQIDMGAFATRTDLAKQVKLGTTFAADGTFMEDFKRMFPSEKIVKINKVLFVHN